MKIKMNKAGNGDCFLIQTNHSTVLIDGGTSSSYNGWSRSLQSTDIIDALFITHIDNDHVNGIIKLLDSNLMDNLTIKNIFFNGSRQITEFDVKNDSEYDSEYDSIASNFSAKHKLEVDIGFSEGTSLSYLIESKGLMINALNDGKAIHQNTYQSPIVIGDISCQFLGPTLKSIKKLRLNWLDVLEERGIKRKILTKKHAIALESYVKSLSIATESEFNISSNTCTDIDSLANSSYIPDKSLANETSFSFILRCGKKSILMLGDAHVETILEWMDEHTLKTLAVDAIKISHHGSKHNINKEFIKRVDCNRYLISTNGKKSHPDLETLAIIATYSSKPHTQISINYEIDKISNDFIDNLSKLPNPAKIYFNQEEISL
ncbi:MBL fold metallo-hydrolase [Colwellia sp. Arc7-635]|uniref:ComEC/Rec2 family competence protein n=1 Tax=Colwellia sp. Arc7-635 TaxID=2497879 RepID=UPI000F8575F5|nr:MBL fold metallo-hydrolase [Colwellia sp. Arc7-635]AZQ84903.1 MBL fold metallo-hydrolase [Colwellia sp. Arc7-635]